MTIESLHDFRTQLKQFVVGQDELINTVTITLYRHLVKFKGQDAEELPESTNNLLIAGQTGTGKTYTVKKAAELLGIPFLVINGSELVPSGWTGTPFETLLGQKLNELGDHSLRQFPIIFIDEFDKCILKVNSDCPNHHILMQSSFLAYLEGIKYTGKHAIYNTNNFCFILAGTFSSIYETPPIQIGFEDKTNSDCSLQDKLSEFGLMPEFMGRILRYIKTNDFTKEMYRDILCNKEFIYHKWVAYLKNKGYTIFGEPNYTLLIEEAYNLKLGARGLIQLLSPEIDRLVEQVDIHAFLQEDYSPNKIRLSK